MLKLETLKDLRRLVDDEVFECQTLNYAGVGRAIGRSEDDGVDGVIDQDSYRVISKLSVMQSGTTLDRVQ